WIRDRGDAAPQPGAHSHRRINALGGQRVLYAAAPVFGADNQVDSLVYLATPLPANGLPRSLILQITGAVLAGGCIAGLAGILLARNLSLPLEDLDRAAEAVSRGNLDQQVPIHETVRELGSLGQSFNEMTASLRRSTELKNAFIADVTHELRTPLTVLKGTVETLQDGALDDKEGRIKLLDSMKRETERMIRLVNQLLVLARSDADSLDLEIQTFDLAVKAQERADILAPLASRKGVQIVLRVPPDADCHVSADPSRTAQVIDNLLDNALRYAPPGSAVTLSLERSGKLVQCSIEDAGPGIPEKDLPKIFNRFYRVEAARDRESGGSGLGLAIVKALTEAQGGVIQAVSEREQGTCLTFSLPAPKLTED
ncbi:MAG: ATP-binding protein, partial [Anaerolineales bacterium]